MKMKVWLSYNYGGDDIRVEGYVNESGTPVYNVTSNPDFIPSEGDTITVTTQYDLSYVYRNFKSTLNNKVYFLLTNSNNPTIDEFTTYGTSIGMAISSKTGNIMLLS